MVFIFKILRQQIFQIHNSDHEIETSLEKVNQIKL